jgi:hypothetical protein
MTPARLIPVYLSDAPDGDFVQQVDHLRTLLASEAELLEPLRLGAKLPEADAVVLPQLLGAAFRQVELIKSIDLPLLVITSEFGTVSMWDWELRRYLSREGVQTVAPTNLEQTKAICRGLAVRRALSQAKFVVYQDNPGTGTQPSIFKRFYWWEDECSQRMFRKFGVTIERRSFAKLGAAAKLVSDREAEAVWREWQSRIPLGPVPWRSLSSALKLYIALKRELDLDSHIQGMGINCLNESRFSDTTPCLAWNMLFEEQGLIWGCEADTVSMMTEHILHKSLDVPVMMTNLYPFLIGQAALKHERIPSFPEVEDPENHILVAHSGYLGVLPMSFSTTWTLRPKVLAIVDDNAIAIDARLPIGDITLAKLDPTFESICAAEGELRGYAQYPGSDCENGAVIRVHDGRNLVEHLPSHHAILMTGHRLDVIRSLASVFALEVEAL